MRPQAIIGQTIDNYQIIECVGRGGMATVYLGRDVRLGRDVALKVFQAPEEFSHAFLKRFEREARIVAGLDHPHIVKIHSYGEYKGQPFYAMPYYAHGSLRDYLRMHKTVSPAVAVKLMTAILQALQYAHERHLIHRDIKPDNMLFLEDASLVLSDFGLVKVFAETQEFAQSLSFETHAGSILGTPLYMAPEQIQGHPVPASDIYSMGIVLYEMLTGRTPFQAQAAMQVLTMHLTQVPPALRELKPDLPQSLEDVVLRALAKDPGKRYEQPVDFLLDLLHVATDLEGDDTPLMLPERQERAVLTDVLEERTTPLRSRTDSHYATEKQPTMPLPQVGVVRRERKGQAGLVMLTLILLTGLILGSGGAWFFATGQPALLQRLLAGNNKETKGGTTSTPTRDTVKAIATPSETIVTVKPVVVPDKYDTSCPAQGQARKAQMPLRQGANQQQIVYVVNDRYGAGTILNRFDSVVNSRSQIKNLGPAEIGSIQLSQDRQWILFTSDKSDPVTQTFLPKMLQMIRIDGKGLQTLYCTQGGRDVPSLTDVSWSPYGYVDNGYVVFNEGSEKNGYTLHQLNLATGKVQSILRSATAYKPIGWSNVDTVIMHNVDKRFVYALPITDTDMTESKLAPMITLNDDYHTFMLSNNGHDVYISNCKQRTFGFGQKEVEGPCTIRSWDINNATVTNMSETMPSTDLAVSDFIYTDNGDFFLSVAKGPDNPKNGLWLYSGLTKETKRIMPPEQSLQIFFGEVKTPLLTISPDKQMYLVQMHATQAVMNEALYYGSVTGGIPIKFAQAPSASVRVVGWGVW